MAEFEIEGMAELNAAFAELESLPEDVTSEMLDAMGQTTMKRVKEVGEQMGVRDPDSNVHILDKITMTKPVITKRGGSCAVTFKGSRTRGKKKTRNAEIAFINEYGRSGNSNGKGRMKARPFISTMTKRYSAEVTAAGEKIFNERVDKIFQ